MIIYTDGGYKHATNFAYGSCCIEHNDGTLYEIIHWDKFAYPVNTNNEAEYATFMESLILLLKIGVKEVIAYTDSQLMQRQLIKQYKIKKPELQVYAEKIWELMKNFDIIEVRHVPRTIIVGKLGH